MDRRERQFLLMSSFVPSTPDASPAANDALAGLIDVLRPTRRIVAFTGAGISTESGIPDYRGPGGVWERNAPPTLGDFLDNPETQRAYWKRRRETYPALAAAEPNDGHRALAALERAGRLLGVITPNIDGLHQRAGNDPERVVELHGTAHQVRCMACGAVWSGADIQARQAAGEAFPHCSACGGALRTATILFGEPLPAAALRRAILLAQACDAMLVVGSSLVVQPAARLPRLARDQGAKLAIVNRMTTPLDPLADVRVIGNAGPTLAAVAAALTD
jgi:NAD-dependent protein deacetylase/lipoamidase